MPRLPASVFAAGVFFSVARALFSAQAPLRALGILELHGADPTVPLPLAPTSGPAAMFAVQIAACWGLLMASALLLALEGARRGEARAWLALAAWWSVALGELLSRTLVTAVSVGHESAFSGLFTGAWAMDDVCCCLPVSAIWLIALGGALVAAGAQHGRTRGRG
ncbi:MAG: hypothetical protein Q8P18_29760 [Pseudomonadota bacterium]|nr:hypothetical protein [Pseudomonadota bacterium]